MTKTPAFSQTHHIGIAAHVDAGKTTLTERMLYYGGISHKIGEVHDGAAHMDYLTEEQIHGITITAAVTQVPWRDHLIQLIDTPGHVDFTIEVERSMRILDGCVIVLDGVRGVETQTETVWRQRDKFALPALFFINKLDRPGADYDHALRTIRQRLGGEPVAVTVPWGDQGAVAHLLEKNLITFAGEKGEYLEVTPWNTAIADTLRQPRETLLLAAAEGDDTLAEQVLTNQEPTSEVLWQGLRSATLDGRVYPCFAGSALRNQGVQPLLDGITRLLPTPTERPVMIAHRLDGGEEPITVNSAGPLLALVFKVQLWEGRRHVFVRLYRGSLKAGDAVVIPGADGHLETERVARLFNIDAGKKTRIEQSHAGEIVLLAGLRKATTGDTLCAPDHPLFLEPIETREPVLGLALEAAASSAEDKFLEALDKLQQEDPTLKFEEDEETGQRVLRGMGELHLQVALERLQREFHQAIQVGKPTVVVRETIAGSAQAETLFQRTLEPQGKGQTLQARAQVTVTPIARGEGVKIICHPKVLPEGASLNPLQDEALTAGVSDAISSGPLEGAPLQDLNVSVDTVELFGAASTPQALRIAVAGATRKAINQAGELLLQPLMNTEVTVPEEQVGAVLGDLQARHGIILSTEPLGDTITIRCLCPLVNLLGYITQLRSLTQGRGQFTMHLDRFDVI